MDDIEFLKTRVKEAQNKVVMDCLNDAYVAIHEQIGKSFEKMESVFANENFELPVVEDALIDEDKMKKETLDIQDASPKEVQEKRKRDEDNGTMGLPPKRHFMLHNLLSNTYNGKTVIGKSVVVLKGINYFICQSEGHTFKECPNAPIIGHRRRRRYSV